MSCRWVIDRLGDYVDRTMSWPKRGLVLFHLALCPYCRNYLDSYVKTIALAQRSATPVEQVEKAISPSVVAKILSLRERGAVDPGATSDRATRESP